MKVLFLGASSSTQSINVRFAQYVAKAISSDSTQFDLSTKTLPIFSEDEEKQYIPEVAQEFIEAIRSHEMIVISLAEHNGSYTAVFKNLYDWASRIDYNIWGGRKMILLSTSPGDRGGASVLQQATQTFPRMGAEIVASFSLPRFYDNFHDTSVINPQLKADLQTLISRVKGVGR